LYGKGHLRALLGSLFLEWRRGPESGIKSNIVGLAVGGTGLNVTAVLALGMSARPPSAMLSG
jgi:hypothetical protein